MAESQWQEFDGKRYAGGRASEPRDLGWMRGAPPPADKRITFESDAFYDFPQIRWTLSHAREIAPTASIWRGNGTPSRLERAEAKGDVDALAFSDLNGTQRRFDEALYDTYTDGIVVLHRGRIVYERYFGELQDHVPHSCFSITKSYAATLCAALVHEGVLDADKTIPHYLPEMGGSAFGDAPLRLVMDMQTGLDYTEVYADRTSSIWEYARAAGLRPRPPGYAGATFVTDYLPKLRKQGEHGQAFAYKTVNTEVMSWVMARVTGRSLVQLLHERLWAPLGCEEDGYIIVDPAGTPMGGGGLSATLRDLARFGELMRREGDWHGKQVVPAAVVHDTQRGDSPAKFAKAGYTLLPGYSYRNMWWVTHNELDAFEGRGIHGQRLYVAPKAEMVIARFASHPVAASSANDPITLPQFLALGRMLK
ncbi:serine hydrolase domain-containing protein [Ramlibacter sp. PS4R-6]|uniref:serine hydrolase domain-containing protein n=1 Tax=Ramlibacter sp. PS4R-6 TaxID=3133438 RepID=UPI0030A119A1